MNLFEKDLVPENEVKVSLKTDILLGHVCLHGLQLVDGLLRWKRLFKSQPDHFPRETRIHAIYVYRNIAREVVELVQSISLRRVSIEAPPVQVPVSSNG